MGGYLCGKDGVSGGRIGCAWARRVRGNGEGARGPHPADTLSVEGACRASTLPRVNVGIPEDVWTGRPNAAETGSAAAYRGRIPEAARKPKLKSRPAPARADLDWSAG